MRQFSTMGSIAKSVAMLLVVGITAYGARMALGDNEARYERNTSPSPAVDETLIRLAATPIADEDGAEIYMTRCMSCHQMNGRGITGVFPPLTGADWVTGDKGRLIRIVLHGLTGEIDVQGETYSGAMPPWKSFLNDEQTAALLTYIRSSWGNEAPEVTVAEVAKVRAATEERREPWTQEELAQAENQGIPGQPAAGAPDKTNAKADTSKTGN